MKIRLTDLGLKKLQPPVSGQVTHWDTTTPGFGVRCSARAKSYVVMYGRKRQLKTLGRYPELPLSEARNRAKMFLASHALQPEPSTEYDYRTVVEAYLDDCESRVRLNTMKGYRLYLNGITFSGPIGKITQRQVMDAIKGNTSSPSSQNYAFTTFKVFFNWAASRQFLSHNPLAALKRPHKTPPRERVLGDRELKKVLRYCEEIDDRFTQIVELLIYTGQRKGEIANLEWQDVDDRMLIFPASKTKNKREHVVPLGVHAYELLNRIDGGATTIFGTVNDDKPFNGFGKSMKRLLTETSLPHFTLHDLRRTFATNHARIGTPIHVTERLLNHVSGSISGVAAVYNRHSYAEEMKLAMVAYEAFLVELLNSDAK
jgi:integrase